MEVYRPLGENIVTEEVPRSYQIPPRALYTYKAATGGYRVMGSYC